jgi:hypothetical protein
VRYTAANAAPAGKKVLTFIAVKKPEPHWFVRVHPTLRFEALLYEDQEERDVYFVLPALADAVERFGKPAMLVLAITTQSTLFIWPLRLPSAHSGGNDLSRRWNDSARQAALLAEKRWVSIRSNRQAGGYEAIVAEKSHPDPEWPELTPREMLKLGFADRVILDINHPKLRQLREG